MRKTFTWLEWLTYLPPELCFSFMGFTSPRVVYYFSFSWSYVPWGSDSTRRVGTTVRSQQLRYYKTKTWPVLKRQTLEDTHAHSQVLVVFPTHLLQRKTPHTGIKAHVVFAKTC